MATSIQLIRERTLLRPFQSGVTSSNIWIIYRIEDAQIKSQARFAPISVMYYSINPAYSEQQH